MTVGDLDFKSVQTIVDNCRELIEISFYGTCLSSDSIDYICNNLSEKVISIDFSAESVTDDNITALVQRCNRLEHLNLCDTDVTYSGVIEIIETLSNSLINLSLPQEVGLELGLHEMPDMERLEKIGTMPKLKYLHIGDWFGYLWPDNMAFVPPFDENADDIYIEQKKHVEIMTQTFPHLKIKYKEGIF